MTRMTPRSLLSRPGLSRLGRIVPLAAFAMVTGPVAQAAEGAHAVIELFTSQGCASCQPASRMLADFAKKPGIIALTFPVTYWDYLGWKDAYGSTAFNDRQRAYASQRGERQVFTPQAIINGEASSDRSDRDSLERKLRQVRKSGALPVRIRSSEQDDRITIEVEAAPGSDMPRSDPPRADPPRADLQKADLQGPDMQGEIWLLPVLHHCTVAVGQGENKGKVIEYVNVVRGLQRVGTWSGRAVRFEVPRASVRIGEADTYVVVLQGGSKAHPTRILGAAAAPGF